ncbi:MAG: hypothetical protein EBQ85_02530 [Proteobacteria bacterium]|nr:hypothetical protein [Pseudomonadota bacterium]
MNRICAFALLVIVACTSKSHFYERFLESSTLAAPPIHVTPADPDHFSFAMVGDTHVGANDMARFTRILQAAQAEGDEFVILLGDIVDQGDEPSVNAVVKAIADLGLSQKVIPLLGNHDIFSEGWNAYKAAWGASHYVVDIGNSRFIALDTADGVIGEDQMEWLDSQLRRTSLTHSFLLTHYMPVVPGQRTHLRLSNVNEAQRLMRMASRAGVRGLFGGHYHSYCTENIDGVDYVVAGGGGGRRMEPITDYFFIQVKVDGNQVSYQLRRVD